MVGGTYPPPFSWGYREINPEPTHLFQKLLILSNNRYNAQYFVTKLGPLTKRRNKTGKLTEIDRVFTQLLRQGGIRGVALDKEEIANLEDLYFIILRKYPLYRFSKNVQKLLATNDPGQYAESLRRMLESLLIKSTKIESKDLANFSRPAFKVMVTKHPKILYFSVGQVLFPATKKQQRRGLNNGR